MHIHVYVCMYLTLFWLCSLCMRVSHVRMCHCVQVVPTVNCSLDENMQEICRPDLTVTLLNVTYRYVSAMYIDLGQIAGHTFILILM